MSLQESLDPEIGEGYYSFDSSSLVNAAKPTSHLLQAENYGDLSVIRRIEKNADNFPHKIALRYGNQSINYSQLNRYADQFAQQLQQGGVCSNVPVGIFLEPSTESVIALLAVLKLGAIYLPLDAEHPLERLRAIVGDAQPAVLVTKDSLVDRVEALHCPYITLNIETLSGADKNIVSETHASDIAYIFYTSGTTGKPKGVMGTQANLIQYVMSAVRTFEMNTITIMPALARFTFSISLFELLCPLVAGGCVVVMSRDHILDLPRLAATLNQVSMFHMGPSLLKKLVAYLQENPSLQNFEKLRHASSGGDIVRPAVMEGMKAIFPHADCFVIYGCSEIACMGCTFPISRENPVEKTLVGKPFPNVGILLLDENGIPVPAGMVGEIAFSGNGITKGYLNMEALTAEKYCVIGSQRYYRTGDLGRFDNTGNLEMLGRGDFQVKLRGIRIELGDIETYLQKIPGVIEAVAGAIESESGERSLCAYLVLDKANPPQLDRMKNFLAQHLPDYMLPSYYVALDRLPLNFNLKLDRKSLPKPHRDNLLTSDAFTDPTTLLEIELVELWKRTLDLDAVGTRQNFFELGGDSLRAANLIVEVEQKYSRHIALVAFLAAPTIVDMAAIIEQPQTENTNTDLFVARSGSKPALFLIQGALVYRELIDNLEADQAACVVFASEEAQLIGAKNAPEFLKIYASIEALASRYLSAIKAHQPEGPYHLAGFSMGGLIAMEIARMLAETGSPVGSLFLLDCFLPSFLEKLSWRKILFHCQDLLTNGRAYIHRMSQKFSAIAAAKRSLSMVVSTDLTSSQIEELRHIARKKATAAYVPYRFDGKVVLFKATNRVGYEPKDRTLGWGEFVNDLDIYDIAGDHHAILKNGSAKRIANIISDYLKKEK